MIMTDTKQITFEGREYTVPAWVEWVARDGDGTLAGYENSPVLHSDWFVYTDHIHIVRRA